MPPRGRSRLPKEWDFNPERPTQIPEPVDGCRSCAEHAALARAAQRAGEETRAADHRVRMRRHMDDVHRDSDVR